MWSAHPLRGVECRVHEQYPAFLRHPVFALGSSKVAVRFFGLFVSLGSRMCPNCACTQLFLVPYSFLVFCCLGRGVSRCKHCSPAAKGPGPSKGSQVPAWLSCIN